jgi:hypothetical protein
MIGAIQANAVVTAIDALSYLYVTGRYDTPTAEVVRPQPIDSDVVLVERAVGGAPAVYEHLVQDGRYSRTGAAARGQQELADFSAPIRAIDVETDDLNAKPGRLLTYSFDADDPELDPSTGEYMILSAAIAWPVWGQRPRRQCRAAQVVAATVMDTWISDTR